MWEWLQAGEAAVEDEGRKGLAPMGAARAPPWGAVLWGTGTSELARAGACKAQNFRGVQGHAEGSPMVWGCVLRAQ